MADFDAIRRALANNLSTAAGFQFQPYVLSQPTAPGGHILPGEIEYDATFGRGHDDLTFTVQVFVPDTSDVGNQQLLDEFLAGSGGKSIKEAIESDSTLGGACDDLRVTRASGYRRVTPDGAGAMLMCEWTVEVLA